MLRLEDLYRRRDLDHSISDLHVVEFYNILLIEEGHGKHTVDFTDFTCEPGTVLAIRKDQLHRFWPNDQLKGSLIIFTTDFLVSYLEQLESQKSLQLFNEMLGSPKLQLPEDRFREISALVSRMQREYFEINDNYSLGIIRSELHILINQLYRLKSGQKQMIADRKYLSEFIELQKLVEVQASQSLKVQEYARQMGVSAKTLNNICKSTINKTAKEFIDEICIKQIKRLLINTEWSVKEIAYASGFEETTNFFKYFKRHTTLTPEQFRTSS